jgi:adenosylhomocysteine nucleosidase
MGNVKHPHRSDATPAPPPPGTGSPGSGLARPVGFVVGFAAEAALLRRRCPAVGDFVEIAGAKGANAAAGTQTLIARGAALALSFGYAGALERGVRPGTILLAETVIAPDGRRFACDDGAVAALAGLLTAAGVAYRFGALAGSDRAVATAIDKAALRAGSRARAVDMESHGVAAAAAEAGRPMAALRVLLDPAERDLPQAALVALDEQGHLRTSALLAALARRPSEISGLIRLALDARLARRSLGRAAAALARALG